MFWKRLRKKKQPMPRYYRWLTLTCACFLGPNDAYAAMVLNFTPTPSGGIALDLRFQGVAQADSSQDRVLELIVHGGMIKGGGSARSDLYFDDTLVSEITADGREIVPSYVRLGNGISFEQIFVFFEPGIPTGAEVDMHIFATWEAANLAYSKLTPGTYTASRPRFGGAVINVAVVPEPSTLIMWVIGMPGMFCARRAIAP